MQICLPATNLEKYVLELITAIIIIPLGFIIAYIVGILLDRAVISVAFSDLQYSLLPLDFKGFLKYFSCSNYEICISTYFFISVSFLGAIVFNKQRLLKTWGIFFGLLIVFIFTLAIFLNWCEEHGYAIELHNHLNTYRIIVLILTITFFILAYCKLIRKKA